MKKHSHSKWAEIYCEFLDDDNLWNVEAWLTFDKEEEGKVIAYVDNLTEKVVYVDPDARDDEYAQRIIAEKLEQIQDEAEEFERMRNLALGM